MWPPLGESPGNPPSPSYLSKEVVCLEAALHLHTVVTVIALMSFSLLSCPALCVYVCVTKQQRARNLLHLVEFKWMDVWL